MNIPCHCEPSEAVAIGQCERSGIAAALRSSQ